MAEYRLTSKASRTDFENAFEKVFFAPLSLMDRVLGYNKLANARKEMDWQRTTAENADRAAQVTHGRGVHKDATGVTIAMSFPPTPGERIAVVWLPMTHAKYGFGSTREHSQDLLKRNRSRLDQGWACRGPSEIQG